MKLHPSITFERIEAALVRYRQNMENPGFCVACGADADGCEPDARNYRCDECDEPQVCGAEELLVELG